ncbi:MAG: 1-deoxy-D-xylulose-5-phosphate synthase [Actinobacteria bacterium]|nr:1-deoxy-D-xylulose-5-phosphate synthase [Actinomycetota bacterium]
MSSLLEGINSPDDLRGLDQVQLQQLADEIREFVVHSVAATGGHLGPNLGVVELTIALHRVFDSPRDALIWDTGHQAYIHKILTGRRGDFARLRKEGGLSGYPSRAESPHDWVENSHASTALSYADGLTKAWQLQPDEADRTVVAVVGDGSLTGGMAWEALNNIAGGGRPMVIVVNDNARSYSPTIGGVATHLASLRTSSEYEGFIEWGKRTLGRTPVVGRPVYETLHGVKKGLKDVVAPQGLFEDLGLKYLGPVDGHDIDALEQVLRSAKSFPGPVIVHAITKKGYGYPPAEQDEADKFHGVGVIDPETGRSRTTVTTTWTAVFSEELLAAARDEPRIVAISAAMTGPTGLQPFADRYPERFFDVGIAEQHALTSAAGSAMGGLHPVVAVYSTFLNRAYDQILFDVAAHRLPVTVVLDRAGITGDDGASHNGMWDLSMLAGVPGIRVAAPRDAVSLREELHEALSDSGPTVVRFPKGSVPAGIPAVTRLGEVDVLADHGDEVVLVAVGAMAQAALGAAAILAESGISIRVVDPRWPIPVSTSLVEATAGAKAVVCVEDGLVIGGVGAALAEAISPKPVLCLGVPAAFLAQASRERILTSLQLDAAGVAESIQKWLLDL